MTQAVAKSARPPLRPSSFAALLADPEKGKWIRADIGEECGKFLSELYRSGKTLASQALSNAAIPVTQVPFLSGNHGPAFYHHTSSKELVELFHPEVADRSAAHRLNLSEGTYEKEIEFLRTRTPEEKKELGLWFKVFYVAEDRHSSDSYGPLMIQFNFSPQAKVVEQDSSAWPSALREIKRRYPGIDRVCKMEKIPVQTASREAIYHHGIHFIIAEDSGIDFIDYSGWPLPPDHQWFQVLKMDNVISTQVYP